MLINVSQVPGAVRQLAAQIGSREGANSLLVGGSVVDMIQGREAKDWDLEVFGLSYEELERTFAAHSPKTVGRAFGVLKITVDGLDIDLNVPRRDNKVGIGHKGFESLMDPTLTVKEAARRRDFTINSMSLDLLSGEVHDPFGGLADLHAGVLRATDPVSFVEDPLRGLRAMQLLARKAKSVDPATMTLIRGMADSFPELPKERLFEEFRKLFLKAHRPSVGLEFLRDSGWMAHFPELEALVGCPQRPEWHPEGDVWTHSLLAADAAAEVRHLIPEDQREAFVFGVFLHDIGKPLTTITPEMMEARDPRVLEAATRAGRPAEDMLLTAHGHDKAGENPAETFMRRLTDSVKTVRLTRAIVGLHMQPWNLRSNEAGKGAYARLHRKMVEAGGDLTLIGRMCQCDSCATGFGKSLAGGEPDWEHETSRRLFDFASEFEDDTSAVEPKVRGRDLIAAGLKPGPTFGKLLRAALDLQDGDPSLTKEEIIARLPLS